MSQKLLKPVYVLVGTIMILGGVIAETEADTVIATGPTGGVYHQIGSALASIMDERGYGPIELQTTNGSIDNIRRLLDHEANLAIVQGDVLSKALTPGMDDPRHPLKDRVGELRSVASLFPEYTQVLVNTDSPVNRLEQLAGRSLYLGAKGSGSRNNALDILTALGIDSPTGVFDDLGLDEALQQLLANDVDAVFTTSGELLNEQPKYRGRLRMLSIPTKLEQTIRKRGRHYGFSALNTPENRDVRVMYTRALLLAEPPGGPKDIAGPVLRGLANVVANDLQVEIYDVLNSETGEETRPPDIQIFGEQLITRGLPIELHPTVVSVYRDAGLLLRLDHLWWTLAVLMLYLSIVSVSRFGDKWRVMEHFRYWKEHSLTKRQEQVFYRLQQVIDHPLVITLVIIIALILIDIILIQIFEYRFAVTEDARSVFAEMDAGEIMTWLITFSTTGYNDNIFPYSIGGKFAAAMMPLVSVGSVLFVFFYSNVKRNRRVEQEARGLCIPALKGHVLICGWNERMPEVVRQITTPHRYVLPKKVVVVAALEADKPLEGFGFRPDCVYFIRGISSDYEILKKARASDAELAVIAADQRKIQRDNLRSVFTAAALRRYHHLDDKDFPIFAELFFAENETRFKQVGVTKMAPLKSVSERLLIHACMNPGVTELLIELLSLDGSHSAGLVDIEQLDRGQELVDKSVGAIARQLGERSILLLAVYETERESETEQEWSELDFRPDSPYHLVCDNNDREPYRVKAGDKLMIVTANSSRGEKRRQLNKLGNFGATRDFGTKPETVLVAFHSDDAGPVPDVLRPYCRDVIQIAINGGGMSQPYRQDGRMRWNVNNLTVSSLRQIIETDGDAFKAVTRAVVIAPSRSGRAGNEESIFQDDTTLAWCMALRDVFKQEFNTNLHILAEVRAENNVDLFRDLNVAQPVTTDRFVELMLSQMVFHKGMVSEFFLKILNYTLSNEKARMEKYHLRALELALGVKIQGETRAVATASLLERQVQLVAVMSQEGQIVVNTNGENDQKRRSNRSESTVLKESDSLFVLICPDTKIRNSEALASAG